MLLVKYLPDVILILVSAILISHTFYNKNPNLELVWSDEFEYSGKPDPSKWKIQTGDGCPELCGWGNNELQTYTGNLKNVRVEDGILVIEAHKSAEVYTSAKLLSHNDGNWKYGRIEVKAQLPSGRGTWPAIWMLSSKENRDWPADGEIDIMEYVGYNPNMIYGTVHSEAYNHIRNTQRVDSVVIEKAEDKFNVYAIEWTSEQIRWYVNNQHYHTFDKQGDSKDQWPFDHPFHLILNIAVGGNWGGKYGVDDSIWPQQFLIDYVRVYKL